MHHHNERLGLTSSLMRCTPAVTHQLITSSSSSGGYTMPCATRALLRVSSEVNAGARAGVRCSTMVRTLRCGCKLRKNSL